MCGERTRGFSGADLFGLCQRAAMGAMARAERLRDGASDGHEAGSELEAAPVDLGAIEVRRADFDEALRAATPSVTPAMLRALEAWTEARGSSDPGTAGEQAPPPTH